MRGTEEIKDTAVTKQDQEAIIPEVLPPSGHDIFTDPAIAQSLKEDPLYTWFKGYWRQVLVVCLTVAAVVYTRDVFNRNYVVEMQRASEIFSRVRGGYEQLEANIKSLKTAEKAFVVADAAVKAEKTPSDEKTKAVEAAKKTVTEAQAKIDESKKLMGLYLQALGDTREPYGELAPVYRALVEHFGATPEALSKLAAGLGTPPGDFSSLKGDARFVAEIKELAAVRLLIDVPAERAAVRARLGSLIKGGRYVATSAALTLARLSVSPEDQVAASTIISDFVSSSPEQAELLKDEMTRLGGRP